jgi:hypothetical protein
MGLDSVTDQLKAQGINVEVAGHLSWQNEMAEILRGRAAGRAGPLILVGRSRGPTRPAVTVRSYSAEPSTSYQRYEWSSPIDRVRITLIKAAM